MGPIARIPPLQKNRIMNISILGGGFGIYGYAPAAMRIGWRVQTLERYRKVIQSRSELKFLESEVLYFPDVNSLMDATHNLVIALPPEQQMAHIFKFKLKFNHLYMEKPIAPTPRDYYKVCSELEWRKQNFSLAYLFRYLEWFNELKSEIIQSGKDDFMINWTVLRPQSNWKSSSEMGGGLLMYYGVHVLDAFLQIFGCDFADSISVELIGSELVVSAQKLNLKVQIRYDSISSFQIRRGTKGLFFDAASPFGKLPKKGESDPRVDYLANYLLDEISGTNRLKNLQNEIAISRILSSNEFQTE